MKNVLIILLCLPLAAGAQQQANKTTTPKRKCTTIHFEKAMIQYGDVMSENGANQTKITLPQPGDVNFGEESGASTKPAKHNEPVDANSGGVMTAKNVQIGCGSKPVLKGDEMILNYTTNLATLTGHITIAKNGNEKEIGQMALLDLSGDRYKIVCVR